MVSPGGNPNILYKALSGEGAQEQENRLLQAQRYKQEISAADMEMVSRASAHLMGLPDTAARQAAWPELIRQMQSNGFAMRADPSVYPGDAVISARANMGLGVKDQMALRGAQEDATSLGNRWGAPTAQTAPTGGGGVTPTAAGPVEPAALARAQAVRDGLIKRGMDPDTATAFAANALHESAGRPDTGAGDAGASHGLFMWQGPRLQAFQQKYGRLPEQSSLDDQLDFTMSELQGPESLARGRIAAAQGVGDKAAQVSEAYLRPKDTVPEMQRRSGTALQLARQWGAPGAVAQPGGVAARTGGTDVAGPPGTVPTPQPTGAPGAPAQTGGGSGATTAQTPPAATTGGLPDVPPPTPPPPIVARGLTADQLAEVPALQSAVRRGKITAAEADAKLVEYQKQNVAAQAQYQQQQLAYSNAVNTRQNQAQTQANTAEELQLKREDAQRAADKARREAMFTGAPTGWQWNDDHSALVRSPGFEGTDKDERRVYNLEHGDPESPSYAADYAAQKWTMTPNGSYIENDMSQFRPPAHAIQRPTYVPQPTPQSLDEVRKVTVDADTTVQSIDNYLKVLRETDGATVNAFLNNPRDPKAQKLLGAFDALKMAMRGPSAMNTGVLQPAEMQMLREDLVSPQTVRGFTGTAEAAGARLGQIKLALLRKADAELRSVGKDGVIVRSMKEFNALPSGASFYDVDGNRQVKD